jgi:hypothetical protein
MADEGGLAGYGYVHPNAIRFNLNSPNAFANVTKMRAILDPILDKMASFPGIDRKTLFAYPPFDYSSINLTQIAGTVLGEKGPDATKAPTAVRVPGWTLPTEAESGRIPHGPTIVKRHGPGVENQMLMPNGILDQDSILLDKDALTSPKLAEAFAKSMPEKLPGGNLGLFLISGPKVWAQGKDTSVHPAWRKAYVHLVATGAGTPKIDGLRELVPDNGAYVNEVWRSWKVKNKRADMSRLGLRTQTGRAPSGDRITRSCPKSNLNGTPIW